MLLQYITNTASPHSITDQVKGVIEGGCRWVQIRMRDASDEEISKVVNDIKPLCIETETFLIFTDRVELAKTLDVGGVYLGKGEMLPSKARLELGPAAVIGVAAHSFDDILAVRSLDVDYVGIGPFATSEHSQTALEPLGLENIRNICTMMQEKEITLNHVAVGGIKLDDVAPLMEAGVNGVAVSSAIAFAPDIKKATEDFVKALKPFIK